MHLFILGVASIFFLILFDSSSFALVLGHHEQYSQQEFKSGTSSQLNKQIHLSGKVAKENDKMEFPTSFMSTRLYPIVTSLAASDCFKEDHLQDNFFTSLIHRARDYFKKALTDFFTSYKQNHPPFIFTSTNTETRSLNQVTYSNSTSSPSYLWHFTSAKFLLLSDHPSYVPPLSPSTLRTICSTPFNLFTNATTVSSNTLDVNNDDHPGKWVYLTTFLAANLFRLYLAKYSE